MESVSLTLGDRLSWFTIRTHREDSLEDKGALKIPFVLLPDPYRSRTMKAPEAKKIPTSKTLFGTTLHDDYAWLRDKKNPEVMAYLEAENEYTKVAMAHSEAFQKLLYDEMLARIKEDDSSVPAKLDNYWYYTRTEAGKAYPIHCRRKGSMDGQEEVLLDENLLAAGHKFFDLGDAEVSPDDLLLAYTADFDGSENYTLYVKDLTTGELLPDRVEKISDEIEWANDNRTVFYVRLDEETHRPCQMFRHRLGTASDSDRLVFEEPDEAFFLSMGKSKDEKYMFIDLDSHSSSEIYYFSADLAEAEPILLAGRRPMVELGVEHHEGWWYIVTNEDAVNFKLMRTPVEAPGRENWEEVIAHDPAVKVDEIEIFRHYMAIHGRRGGYKNILIRDMESGEMHEIQHPEPVYTLSAGVNLEYDTEKLRFGYSSLVTPATTYEYDMRDRTRVMLKQAEVMGGFDPSLYQSERVYATAPDGEKIPISVVYKREFHGKGAQPILLYGYGAYGMTVDPSFSSARLSLLDRGMAFAIAHVRGGGAMGRPWYEAGKLLHKRNTFTDFIACTEHLISLGITQPDQIAISGGSAGGLLMGAVVNMRPDLFRVVDASVPFVDLMNTMLDASIPLTVIEYDEWGNPNEEAYFKYMYSYSPYDNVRAQAYPDMLISAGLNDPRVHYWEPAKWCAKLRDLKTDSNLLLLKTNMGAGHQGASGRYGYLEELAFDYAFILDRLGLLGPS
ncbi:MAG: Protease 2 [Bacteroidota bacterium]|jgi:oligopeptidase B